MKYFTKAICHTNKIAQNLSLLLLHLLLLKYNKTIEKPPTDPVENDSEQVKLEFAFVHSLSKAHLIL